jgi:hypothetical protein
MGQLNVFLNTLRIFMSEFINKLESKITQQLASQRVGYLLGAGTSFLSGDGFPLESSLWESIKEDVSEPERCDIEKKIDEGARGLEHALDLLDDGGVHETPHRFVVTDAIASLFCTITPPLDYHRVFLSRIGTRSEQNIPVFCLNYDPLLERAADAARVSLTDGFRGFEAAYFDPSVFQQSVGIIHRGRRYPQFRPIHGNICLFKLHGSLGWYISDGVVRRSSFSEAIPDESKRLMIPPQRRKATDTMSQPYAALWSEFRGRLRHGPLLINRLVCIGYGMGDEHVNAVLDNALARQDFTLIVFARSLSKDALQRWGGKRNVIVVTNEKCFVYGEVGPGHPDMWSFERLINEV